MKRIILTFGSIGGLIVAGLMLINVSILSRYPDMASGEIAGYVSMIIALSTIFFGIKSYRDNHQEGAITFGKGFLLGLLIALLASTFYVVAWEIYFNATDQRFAEQYYSQTVADIRDSGLPQPEADAKVKEMEDMRDLYVNNPLFRVAITYMEILPVGLLISLISAAVLRRKEVLPA